MKNKKLVAILTMLCFLFTLMPTMALADTATASYGIKVAGTEITSANAANVLGDGKVSYNAETTTLTLNGVDITTNEHGIECTGTDTLNINLTGTNSITVPKEKNGINADGKSIVITGTGTLDLSSILTINNNNVGIKAKNTTIKDGVKVTFYYFEYGVNDNDGTHTIEGTNTVVTMNNVNYGYGGSSSVEVKAGILEIIGRGSAFRGENLTSYEGSKILVSKLNNWEFGEISEYSTERYGNLSDNGNINYLKVVLSSENTTPTPNLTFPVTVLNGTIDNTGKATGNFIPGAEVTIKANTAAEGQDFAGWSVVSGGVTLDNADNATTKFTMPRSTTAVKVEATYNDNPAETKYTVEFKANGGTVVSDSSIDTLTNIDTLPNPLPTVEKANYTFDGWYTDEQFTAKAIAGAEITANTTLYAKWTEDSGSTDEPAEYKVWVNGVQVKSTNCNDDTNKWSYDAEKSILTLEDGFTGTGLYNVDDYSYSNCRPVIYSEQDLTINIAGDSTITLNNSNISDGARSHGIFCKGDLTFVGSGTLTVTQSSSGGYDPIQCKKTITFGSANDKQQFTGNVIAVVENGTQAGSAISAGEEIVINSGIVEATNSDSRYNAMSGKVTLNGGTLTAKGNGQAIVGTLQGSNDAVTVNGGTLELYGGDKAINPGKNITAGTNVKLYANTTESSLNAVDYVAEEIATYKYIGTVKTTSTPGPTPTPDDDKEDTTPSTSTSGGGFTGKYNYPVVTGAVENADVDFSKNYAVAGDTVAITVAPEAGKQVDTVIVTDKDGKVIPVTKVDENKYTFTMPASKVTVSVTTETADAADNADEKEIVLQIGNTTVLVDGSAVKNDVAPTLLNGRTLVPLRVIVTALGGDVDWDEATRTVTITIDGKVLKLVIDEHIPGFGQGATIMDSRTYVPIRYVGQYIGADVEWIKDTQKIVIVK